MHQASVGFHCPECARAGRQKVITARSLTGARPLVTMALVAANLAIYLADLASTSNSVSGLGNLATDGALYGPAVADGDWWRPITSGFVHAGLLHVGFNMFLLFQLGRLLEPAIKWWGFIVLYVMSLLGGSLLVLILDPNTASVGASGAVFGLMGATFVAMRSRGIDPFSTGIGPLIVINLLLTFTIPDISIGAHVGGLIAGVAGGLLIWEWGPRLGKRWAQAVPVAVCGALAVALYVGCLVVASSPV
jgi:membrane associated rhomboid family serine protease